MEGGDKKMKTKIRTWKVRRALREYIWKVLEKDEEVKKIKSFKDKINYMNRVYCPYKKEEKKLFRIWIQEIKKALRGRRYHAYKKSYYRRAKI